MLTPAWSFTDMIPVVIVAALVVFLPGTGFMLLVSRRVLPALAVGPAITTTLVAVVGVLAAAVSLPWGTDTLVGSTLLLWGVGLLLGLAGRRWGLASRRDWGVPARLVPALVALAVTFALAAYVWVKGTGAPGNFAQAPDMIFHYALVEQFAATRDISSLTADLNTLEAPGFYPAALHGLGATVALLTGAPAPVALSALMLAIIGLVWPVGLWFFLRAALRVNGWTAAMAVLLALANLSFPVRTLVHGPVWPLVFAYALVLPVLALVTLAVRLEGGRPRLGVLPLVVFVLTVPGLFFAHTSALFVVALLGWIHLLALTFAWARRGAGRIGWAWCLGLAVVGIAGVLAMASVVPPGMAALPGPVREPLWVVRNFVLGWSHHTDRGVIVGWAYQVLVLVGLFRAVRTWRLAWLGAGYLVVEAIVATVAMQRPAASWILAWPFYGYEYRMQAVAVLAGIPLAALGLRALVGTDSWPRRTPLLLRRAVVSGAAVVLALAAVPLSIEYINSRYYTAPAEAWLTEEEAAALHALSATLPDDAVVAANPLNGATYLAIIGPERMLIPTEKAGSPDVVLLRASLEDIENQPDVCSAVHRHGVTYVITGGDPYPGQESQTALYVGIDSVGQDPAFELVERAGPYNLYRVPDCPR